MADLSPAVEATIAADLNDELTILLSGLCEIADEPLSDMAAQMLNDLIFAAERVAGRVNGLAEYAKRRGGFVSHGTTNRELEGCL